MINKYLLKIFIISFLVFGFSNFSYAGSTGLDVNLNIGYCNYNNVCDSGNEDEYNCPADCLPDTPGGGGSGGGGTVVPSGFFNNLTVEVSYNSATIKWDSVSPSKSNLKWGKTSDYKDGFLQNINFVKSHVVFLDNLTDGTLYYFSIEAENALGDVASLENQYFQTLVSPDRTPPANPTNIRASSQKAGVDIFWKNPLDLDFDYVRIVRGEDSFPSDPFSGRVAYEGSGQYFTDSNVVLDAKYYYSLFSRDKTGNYSSGSFVSIIYTLEKEGEIIEIIDGDEDPDVDVDGDGEDTTNNDGTDNDNNNKGGHNSRDDNDDTDDANKLDNENDSKFTPLINDDGKLPTPILSTAKVIRNIINTETGYTTSKVVTSLGVGLASYTGIVSVFANVMSFGDFFLVLMRLWSLLMVMIGLKKKNRPWGTVYDSVTKQPLDPAYVVLMDLEGNEVATSITDLDGRYGFMVPTGKYRIVVNKTNYTFPSIKLKGKTSDELYPDLYFGEEIEIIEGEVIARNIPMDPLKFDWNEFAKRDQKLMKFFSKRDIYIYYITNTFFICGFILTILEILLSPQLITYIVFGFYILLIITRKTILRPRNSFGWIENKMNKRPLPFSIMRVFHTGSDVEVAHKVADKNGKYYCLIPNGDYYTKIENKNPDESYSLAHVSTPILVKKGYINKKFEV